MKIFKIVMNLTLLIMLGSMLLLPTGIMGLMKFEESPSVLSAQDERVQVNVEGPGIRSLDDPEANVPEDIMELILRMEREYYQTQEPEFVEDVERTEEQEIEIVPEPIDLEEDVEISENE
ncbi:hypothetical protein K0B04_00285 [Patescibacteria group bacterium]|nr:hypothetical protein [Patescibacteria group bacterium]